MSLNPTDLATLSRLLDEVLDLDASAWDDWQAALPDAHRHLLPSLREMLIRRASQRDAAFLSHGPSLGDGHSDETVARDGEAVGPYRLIRVIGSGGMGSVWLAERMDGGLHRNVALKLPRMAWGAGLAERMARERDIGAMLEHPHIARLYDAGVDQQGRPYLAFEYIQGRSIDAWCVDLALDIRGRVALFVQVVRAVGYAHGRLIVHRDLKPSNILVTEDGQIHLLDFGIAKLSMDDAEVASDLTREQGRVLTLRYASPEQLRGEPVGVGSDIYSLAVVLYELLCRASPYATDRKFVGAMEQAILAGDHAPPSSRAIAKKDRKALQGELDAIVGKALKREANQRYATAEAFADDLQRHLDGDRVLARADGVGYRTSVFLRKHRVGVAATALVTLAVVSGAGMAFFQARRAQDAVARASVVREFVTEVFRINEPGPASDALARRLPSEMLLERGARLIRTKFARQPDLQAELYGVVGGIFANMGADDLAVDYASRQVEALEAVHATPRERAEARLLLARELLRQVRLKEADAQARMAVELAATDDEMRPRVDVVLASILAAEGKAGEVGPLLDRVESDLKRHRGPSLAGASAKTLRAARLLDANRFDEAMPLFRGALAEATQADGGDSQAAIDIQLVIAATLQRSNRPDDAMPIRESALAALRAIGGAAAVRAALEDTKAVTQMFFQGQMPFAAAQAAIRRDATLVADSTVLVPDVIRASIDFDLGDVTLIYGDLQAAAPLLATSIPVLERQPEYARAQVPYDGTQTFAAMYAGRHDAADALLRANLASRRKAGLDGNPRSAFSYAWAALNLDMAGRHDAADALLDSAPVYAPMQGTLVFSTFYRDVIPNMRARIQLDRGHADAALSLMKPINEQEPVRFPLGDNWMLHGEALCAAHRGHDGLPLLEHSLAAETAVVYAHHPYLARDQAVTGLCALDEGHRARAVELARLARASFERQPDVSDYFKLPLERLERRLATTLGS